MAIKIDEIEEKYLEAKHLFKNGLYKNAKDIFVELTIKKPFNFEFWFSLAAIYELERNYTQAIISYKLSIVLKPENGASYFHLAQCLLSKNDKKGAIENLKLAQKYPLESSMKERVQILLKQNLK